MSCSHQKTFRYDCEEDSLRADHWCGRKLCWIATQLHARSTARSEKVLTSAELFVGANCWNFASTVSAHAPAKINVRVGTIERPFPNDVVSMEEYNFARRFTILLKRPLEFPLSSFVQSETIAQSYLRVQMFEIFATHATRMCVHWEAVESGVATTRVVGRTTWTRAFVFLSVLRTSHPGGWIKMCLYVEQAHDVRLRSVFCLFVWKKCSTHLF